jgi:glucan 1,3-beta-glucosidase
MFALIFQILSVNVQAKEMIRGVNLGGWLVLEPFITPSIFEYYDAKDEKVN